MRDLTTGREGSLIWRFAIPMLLGTLFQQFNTVIDSIVVGHYVSKSALAAVGAAMPVLFIMVSLIIGLTIGGTIIIAQYFGAKKMEELKKTIDTLIVFLFFSSLLVTGIAITFSEKIFIGMKLPPDLIPMATTYLNTFFLGLVFMFGVAGIGAILRGMGDSKTPLYFLLIACVINIILDFVFVVYFKMGVAGVAWAAVTGQFVAFVVSVIYINTKSQIFRLSFKLKFDKTIFFNIVKIGLPMGLQQSLVGLGMVFMMTIVNGFGTSVIAAFTVAGRIDMFVSMPAMNFSMALATFVGQNIGAGKTDRVRRGLTSTVTITTIISLTLTVVALLFSKQLIHLFTDDADVIRIGYRYLHIVSWFYFMFSVMFTFAGVFRGAGDTIVPMFITLFSLWFIRLPVSYYLSKTSLGTDGIWWGVPIAWFFGFLFSIIYYRVGNWKKKAVVKPIVEPVSVIAE